MTTETLTSREVAEKLDTDPRALRRFLRSDASPMKNSTKGARYDFVVDDIATLKKAFTTWTRGEKAAPVAKKTSSAPKKSARVKK